MDFTALVTVLGMEKLPQNEQQQMFEDVLQTIQIRMNRRLAKMLTEDQLRGLEAATNQGEKESLAELHRLCPDYDKMYQEEIDNVVEEMKRM